MIPEPPPPPFPPPLPEFFPNLSIIPAVFFAGPLPLLLVAEVELDAVFFLTPENRLPFPPLVLPLLRLVGFLDLLGAEVLT